MIDVLEALDPSVVVHEQEDFEETRPRRVSGHGHAIGDIGRTSARLVDGEVDRRTTAVTAANDLADVPSSGGISGSR